MSDLRYFAPCDEHEEFCTGHIVVAPPALDVERLAEAYHRYRLQFPAGTLYCGTDPDGPEYPPQPYEFDSTPCSCHMDMVGTVQRMESQGRRHTVTDSTGACTLPCPACQDIMRARLQEPDG